MREHVPYQPYSFDDELENNEYSSRECENARPFKSTYVYNKYVYIFYFTLITSVYIYIYIYIYI